MIYNAYKTFQSGDRVIVRRNTFNGQPARTDIVGHTGTVIDGTEYLEQSARFDLPHVVVQFDGEPGVPEKLWIQEDGLEFVDPPITDEILERTIASIKEAFHE